MVIEMFLKEFDSYFLTYWLTNFSAPIFTPGHCMKIVNKYFENVAMFRLACVCVNDSSKSDLSSGRISEQFQFVEVFLPFTGEAFCLSVCLLEALDVQKNALNSSACCFVWVWN